MQASFEYKGFRAHVAMPTSVGEQLQAYIVLPKQYQGLRIVVNYTKHGHTRHLDYSPSGRIELKTYFNADCETTTNNIIRIIDRIKIDLIKAD